MKEFKRFFAGILAVVILVVGLPLSHTSVEAETIENSQYSDILYAYSDYLNDSQYLMSYIQDTQGIFDTVYMDYLDSADFIAMTVKESILKAVNIQEWLGIMGSALGVSDYVYENALDNANQLFVKHLLSASQTTMLDTMGVGGDWSEKLSKLAELYEMYAQWSSAANVTDTEKLNEAFQFLFDSGLLITIEQSDIDALKNFIVENQVASKMLSTVGSILEAGKALMTAMVMEDMRVYTVECIFDFSPNGALCDGMWRLKNQLSYGFVSYFTENFLKGELIKEVSDKVVEGVVGYAMGSVTPYTAVKLIAEVGVFVVFDCILNTPSLDEFTTQRIITEYAYDCSSMILSANSVFSKRFGFENIQKYQNLYTVLRALTDASFEASETISRSSNSDKLAYCKRKYQTDDIFKKTIEDVKKIVDDIPVTERKRTFYDEWYVYESAVVSLGSDVLSASECYFPDGEFYGNVILSETKKLTIPEGYDVKINGDLSLRRSWGSYVEGDADLIVNGALEVTGTVCPSYYGEEKIINNGTLKLGGNVACEIESTGDIIYNGTEQQWIDYDFKANNVYVENKAGIKYRASPIICGEFLLNGNPLDNDGYPTIVGSKNFTYDSVSDYKSINISVDYSLTKDIIADITVSETKKLTVPSGYNVKINGDLSLWRSWGSYVEGDADLVVDGVLEITGTVCPRYFGYEKIINNGTLKLGGNVACDIESTGDIIYNGTEQQWIDYGFKANNVYVENKAGIKYRSSPEICGEFLLNGNPLDNDGYPTIVGSKNFTYDSVSDYKKLSIDIDYTLKKDIIADIDLLTFGVVTVPAQKAVKVIGTIKLSGSNVDYTSTLINDGELEIIGSMYCDFGGRLKNNGMVKVTGNFFCNYEGVGTLIFNGNEQQSIETYYYYTAINKIILENSSDNGVVLRCPIVVTELFNHNGNNFTLFENGNGSDFADYDGDDMKDNIDPVPTEFDEVYYYVTNYGNVNYDDRIDAVDIVNLKKAVTLLNKEEVYDVNKDGGINSVDMTLVRNYLLNDYSRFK